MQSFNLICQAPIKSYIICVCLTYMYTETYTTCKTYTERLQLSSMSSCEYSKYNNCEKKALQPLLAAKNITDSIGTKKQEPD